MRLPLAGLLVLLSLSAAACGSSSGSNDNPTDDAGADTTPPDDTAPLDADDGAGDGFDASTACSLAPRDFWTWDLSVMPPADKKVNGTCVAQTDHAYVFVATDTWTAGGMTQAQIDNIVAAFEHATPADKTRGAYQTDVDTFGDPPDVDKDPHIYLFYYPMGKFSGFSFDGFFRDQDETKQTHSNQIEMLHLNAADAKAPDSDYMLGVVIHEFVHLINYKYQPSGNDDGWIHEMLAESAMTLGGYMTDLPTGKAYVKTTATTPLCVTGYSDYGATFSWGSYMLDRFGTSVLRAILQDPAVGIPKIAAHLPSGLSFRDAFGEFMVANLLDQHGIGDGRYGYVSIHENALGSETAGTIDGASHDSGSVQFGARMLRFTPAAAGTISFLVDSPQAATLAVHSVVFDPAAPDKATVTAQTVGTSFDVAVTAGQVIDLVVAVALDASYSGDSTGVPTTAFTYTATAK